MVSDAILSSRFGVIELLAHFLIVVALSFDVPMD